MPTKEIFKGIGVPIKLNSPQDFLKIKETLTRIGLPTKELKRLVQTCNILHKRDPDGNSHYAILHFKELFILDGKKSSLTDQDTIRRNNIAALLEDWKLITILDEIEVDPSVKVKIIPHKEKHNWELVSKYQVGKKPKD